MTNMTRRAYAASLGLAKPDTVGRLSAAAKEAIVKAELSGMVFADNAPARKSPTVHVASATTPKAESKSVGYVDPKAVRVWAKLHGIDVNARGRLSKDVVELFLMDHPEAESKEQTVSVRSGKDIRPHAARTRSPRTDYSAYYRGKRIRLSENEACKCGVSLSHCKCGSPSSSVWTSPFGPDRLDS